jgi:hypothetical protein
MALIALRALRALRVGPGGAAAEAVTGTFG